MGRPGPKPKPHLEVVREGNPGKRRRKEPLSLPPAELVEPDWVEVFPEGGDPDEALRAREVAGAAWARVTGQLEPRGLLAEVDLTTLRDYCVCEARVDQCERDISIRGVWVAGERGAQKNPSVTAANQYRTQLKFYVGELWLSPSARTRAPSGAEDGDADDSPFDV